MADFVADFELDFVADLWLIMSETLSECGDTIGEYGGLLPVMWAGIRRIECVRVREKARVRKCDRSKSNCHI